jgi:hypothetical protein
MMIEGKAQLQWSVFGGPQVTFARYVIGEKKQEEKMKYGFQLGLGLKVPFENRIYFVPQVFYSLKGYKVTFDRPSVPPDLLAIDNNTTLHTFEIAPLLQLDLNGTPSHFFVRLGPSIDVQMFGHESFNRSAGGPVNRKMKFGFEDYGHFGANLLVHFGYETSNGFSFYAQYTHGFGSVINTDNGPRVYHRAAGISIAYSFRKKN